MLSENCRVDELEDRLSSVSLIVFNYDRCIEYYLYYQLQSYYGIPKEVAAVLLNKLKIYHPYGVVGYLPWQESLDGDYFGKDKIDFGHEPTSDHLLDLASQIRTFTEGTDPTSSEITASRELISLLATFSHAGSRFRCNRAVCRVFEK